MRFTTVLTFGVMAAALGLSACGGGSSEFAAKVKANCEKAPEGKSLDCECLASTLDKELDDKTKSVMLAIEAAEATTKSPQEALNAAGVSEAEAPALMAKLSAAMGKVAEACIKKG